MLVFVLSSCLLWPADDEEIMTTSPHLCFSSLDQCMPTTAFLPQLEKLLMPTTTFYKQLWLLLNPASMFFIHNWTETNIDAHQCHHCILSTTLTIIDAHHTNFYPQLGQFLMSTTLLFIHSLDNYWCPPLIFIHSLDAHPSFLSTAWTISDAHPCFYPQLE